MTPDALARTLQRIVEVELPLSVMIWGPPGIGKSATVRAVAQGGGLEIVDLRLSQLAPTDLRGLPVPGKDAANWLAPEFLPRRGKGILFLDEINMAPPAVQGIAQQLVLDRRVGSYQVPEGWFVWAAGNRRDDRAGVFEMPAPLANRFLHYDVEVDPDGFLRYAARSDLSPDVIAFIGFRPQLLHRVDRERPAWPSPRTWEMASRLRRAGLSIAPAVGEAAADEFEAFQLVYRELPDLGAILAGQIEGVAFPEEPSRRYAITLGLAGRAANGDEATHAMRWLAEGAPHEWTRLFVGQVLERMRALRQTDRFVGLAAKDPALVRFLQDYRALVDGA